MELTLEAPAKVNLFLRIAGRRADGMHELVTLMQPLTLADRLTVRLGGQGLSLTCDRPELAGPDNLVLRAARAYFAALGRPGRASFHLQKNIPVAAGLGGGSSDAAATLTALNALCDGALTPLELVRLAAGLGADVPFFLAGVTALCSGIGELVRPMEDFPLLDYVLVNPGIPVSTAWVYAEYDSAWTTGHGSTKISRPIRRSLTWQQALVNDLEPVTLGAHPVLGELKAELVREGALAAMMSGSGPTLFGVFADSASAGRAADSLRGRGGLWVRACRGATA